METKTNPFNDYVFINATPSDRGSFTLATEKALAKLEKFQLPDPTYFILQWVQALAAAQAQHINMSYSTTSLKGSFELAICFDGPGYSRNELDGLYDHVFRSGRDRSVDRLRELALGWLSAGSLRLTHLSLASNGWVRVKEPGRPESTESVPMAEGQSHKLIVRGKGHHDFEEIVKRRCAECVTDLTFNGDSVSGGNTASGVPWPNRPFHIEPTKGVMGATYGGNSSHISFLRYGVEFVSRPEKSLQPPVIVRVSDPTLSKNVSQTDVVKDEAYEEFLGRLRSEMKRMGLQLTTKRIPSYQREALNKFVQAYLVSHIDVRVFDDPRRLELMGEEFRNLVEFPMFRTAGGRYLSLSDLREEYRVKGYLLYSIDERAIMARWQGTLLVLEVEEVQALKKYFPNLTALSWDEVRTLCQGGMRHKLSDARRRPIIWETAFEFHRGIPARPGTEIKLPFSVQVPDVYPNGLAVMVKKGELNGTTVPDAPVSLIIESEHGVLRSTSDLARLKHQLQHPVKDLLGELCGLLSDPSISSNQSRARYAELACEQILYLQYCAHNDATVQQVLQELDDVVSRTPLIGLENGELVSADDLSTFAKLTGEVYLGGAFVEGLESGALDPMPCARRLVENLLDPSTVVSTDRVRKQISSDPDLKFKLRRQTVMKGLAATPNPAIALKNFASEAAAQAEELARMEQEYKQALERNKLFVKPDQARLEALSQAADAEEFEGFDLGAASTPGVPQETLKAPSHAPTQRLQPPPLPALEADLEMLRHSVGDFCSTPGAVHVERREETFSFHLSNKWVEGGSGEIQVLQLGAPIRVLTHSLPVEGFIRLSPLHAVSAEEVLPEAVEQLVLKILEAHRSEPTNARQRKRLQSWLLECCSLLPHWRKVNYNVASALVQQPLVPCLGGRLLSWSQLLRQAQRLGHTPVFDARSRDPQPDPLCDVIAFEAPWRDQVMAELEFPRQAVWRDVKRELDFDTMLRSSLREILNVLSANHDALIKPEVVGKLSGEASFWTRWRSGFLSWDESGETALVNPEHKLGKKLIEKFQPDVTWSSVLACALFSTINRGLEEVDDHHERQFLLGLLDSLD